MHGLINRAIQCFYRDTYGPAAWGDLVRALDLEFSEFEPMLDYDNDITFQVLDQMANALEKERATVLEDIGTYLVSHPNVEALRRLLRFSGVTFLEFLHSLDDLPDRARLAVEDLILPGMELREHGSNRYTLHCTWDQPGFGHVMVGVLRTMADDYGALVFLDHMGAAHGVETIEVTVFESAFAEGRHFDLAADRGHAS